MSRPSALPNSVRRLLGFFLTKLDEEPLHHRALLCEDLAAFVPDEAVARQLLDQARALRHADQRTRLLRLTLQHRPALATVRPHRA